MNNWNNAFIVKATTFVEIKMAFVISGADVSQNGDPTHHMLST